jgi:hypothetical protein
VIGLGRNPDDVNIGGLTVDAQWFGGNATQNFWRSAENFMVPGSARWAVAQAAPMRRVDIRGDLNLAPTGFGFASGGYIADSRIVDAVQPFSQQQWFTRDSTIGSNQNAVWNNVFVGVQGAPAQSFPNPPYTTVATTPVIREKPYLFVDSTGAFTVLVPNLRTNTSGATWLSAPTPGTVVPLSQFYVASRPTPRPRSTRRWPRASTCCSRRAPTPSTRPSTSPGPTPSCSASGTPRSCRSTASCRCRCPMWTV